MGDLLDFAPISRFRDAATYTHTLQDELDQASEYLASLRSAHPKARIVYQRGNHEHRLKYYLLRNAEALSELRGLSLASLLSLDKHRVELVDGRRYLAGGSFVLKHGTHYGVYATRRELLAEGRSGMCGHNHRDELASFTPFRRRPVSWWHVGCLCGTEPKYMKDDDQAANWQQALGFLEVGKSGVGVELVPIYRGACTWRGREFHA
jgi:UDP-2,3-diacylglucosamine pyrophosphatase LpxH